jgi:hypothetical protein
MSLGYETYEDNRTFEQEGLTGTVRKYITEDMQFPCFIVQMDTEHKIEKYKIDVLQKMFKTVDTYDEEEAKLVISIYISGDDRTIRLGQITPKQVKPFLRLFEKDTEQIIGYFDKDTELKGDFLYVLSE